MRRYTGLIFAGLVFLAFPNFNLLDATPDFIGTILIMLGLSKLRTFDGNFMDAYRSAKYLTWISVLRLIFCVWANGGHRDYVMPFTFIICVLEMIFMISLFRNIYLGLDYTLMRADCEKHLKNSSEAFTMAFIFTIASRVLEFAPHICDILKLDAELSISGDVSSMMSVAQMKSYILAACLVFNSLLGLIFLVITAKAWFGISLDKKYALFLKEKYENYLVTEREKHLASCINRTYFLMTLAIAFVFNFYIDGVNFIPTAMTFVLMFFATISLSGFAEKRRNLLLFIVCLLGVAASCLGYIFMTKVHFGMNYLYASESFNSLEFSLLEGKSSVTTAVILSAFEFIMLFLVIFICTKQMQSVFAREKRSVAVPMLGFVRILMSLACLAGGVRNVLTTIEGHLATNSYVLEYIRNKTVMTKQSYDTYIQSPLVTNYEAVSSAAYASAFIAAALMLICVLYMFRIRRFTDGDGNTDK